MALSHMTCTSRFSASAGQAALSPDKEPITVRYRVCVLMCMPLPQAVGVSSVHSPHSDTWHWGGAEGCAMPGLPASSTSVIATAEIKKGRNLYFMIRLRDFE